MMATTVPHEMACGVLKSICGVDISKNGIEDMVADRGEKLLKVLDADAETYAPYDETGLPLETVGEPAMDPEFVAPIASGVAYIEIDGVVPMTRERVPDSELTGADKKRLDEAAAEKSRGGKGRRFNLVGREVKNAVLYTADDCAQEGASRGCLLKKRYVSWLGTWSVFVTLVWVELRRLRFDRANLVVILGDGADWIRSVAKWLPFETLLILDLFHVKHRIMEVANLLHGAKSDEARRWAHVQYERVESDQMLMVIDALRFACPSTTAAATTTKVDELKTYLLNNLDRTHYPAYRARGLRVSSASVESANFHVTGQRMKCQGMRWQELGARDMAALRADLFNGRWERRTRELLAA